MTKLPMTDPIFALIDDAKLLGRVAIVVDDEADARYFALSDEERAKLSGVPFAKRSKAHAEAKAAQKAWEAAIKRVRKTKPTTRRGEVARLSYLSDVGEDDFETALDMVARIVERAFRRRAGVMLPAAVAFVLLYCLLRSPDTVLLLAVLGAALVAG